MIRLVLAVQIVMSLTEVLRTCIFLTLNGRSKGLSNKVRGGLHQPVLHSGLFQRYSKNAGFEFLGIFKILGYKNAVHFVLDILKNSHVQNENQDYLDPQVQVVLSGAGVTFLLHLRDANRDQNYHWAAQIVRD